MPLDQSDYERIQTMIDRSMPRIEYEQRHQALTNQVQELKSSIKELAIYGAQEHEKIRGDYQASMKEIRTDVKEIKEGIASSQGVTLRYVISQVVTFFIGSGVVGIIEFLRR